MVIYKNASKQFFNSIQKLLWGLQNELLPSKQMMKYRKFTWLIQTFLPGHSQ